MLKKVDGTNYKKNLIAMGKMVFRKLNVSGKMVQWIAISSLNLNDQVKTAGKWRNRTGE
jgi:hypothetical protein